MSFKDVLKKQQHNIREYGMYIAFVVIVIFFAITTKGLFVSSRNIGNLVNAMSYIAVLAVGMTLVIVIRHIDLSVGYLAGFLGAITAIALKYWHLPLFATIPFILVLGVCAGYINCLSGGANENSCLCCHPCWMVGFPGSFAAGYQKHRHDSHREYHF